MEEGTKFLIHANMQENLETNSRNQQSRHVSHLREKNQIHKNLYLKELLSMVLKSSISYSISYKIHMCEMFVPFF